MPVNILGHHGEVVDAVSEVDRDAEITLTVYGDLVEAVLLGGGRPVAALEALSASAGGAFWFC